MASKDDIRRIAEENDLSEAAVAELDRALGRGNRRQAQFSHPDLGGSGQWMAGGMTQVGDMFNNDLKAKVDAACSALSSLGTGKNSDSDNGAEAHPDQHDDEHDDQNDDEKEGTEMDMNMDMDMDMGGSDWWPEDLGSPASSGGQNDSGYAVFPEKKRLAVKSGDDVKVYDTADHDITGVSQQQGSIEDTTFSTSGGDTVRAGDLDEV